MKQNFLYQITAASRAPDQRGYRPQIPILFVLCPQLNLLNHPPRKKFLGTSLTSSTYLPDSIQAHPTISKSLVPAIVTQLSLSIENTVNREYLHVRTSPAFHKLHKLVTTKEVIEPIIGYRKNMKNREEHKVSNKVGTTSTFQAPEQ